MPVRICEVAFTDVAGVRHSVEVPAESLFEAVALGLHEMRSSGLTAVTPGPATAVTVRVKATAEAEHTVTMRQFQTWLAGSARSPRERLMKQKLRELGEQE